MFYAYDVTSCDMSCASSSLLKRKRKKIQKKRNIKSRKIDKRKRKMLVSKSFYNIKSRYTIIREYKKITNFML